MYNSPHTNVLDFYYTTNYLKELVRSGWKQWNVQRERLESVAEHIYSTCMLALAISSEFSYSIDLEKVILMLTVHELEEIYISDITPIDDVSPEEKIRKGHIAVHEILSPLVDAKKYEALIWEFDNHFTPEAKFAYMCDKLDADLMSLYYDQNLDCTVENGISKLQNSPKIQDVSQNGLYTMGECFYIVESESDRLDKNFHDILYAAKRRFDKWRT